MAYEDFRGMVEQELRKNPEGLTWTQIKANLNLPQKVPNNKWVNRMEEDIGLTRVKRPNGTTIWKLRRSKK